MSIRAGDSFWPTGPQFHPSAPFTIPRWICLSPRSMQVSFGKNMLHPARQASLCTTPLTQCPDTFQLLLSSYRWLTWQRQWGMSSPNFFLLKAVCLEMHFPGHVTHLHMEGPLACLFWSESLPMLVRRSRMCLREWKKSQCGCYLLPEGT